MSVCVKWRERGKAREGGSPGLRLLGTTLFRRLTDQPCCGRLLKRHIRFRAKRQQLNSCYGLLPESQDRNPSLTVLCARFGSGTAAISSCKSISVSLFAARCNHCNMMMIEASTLLGSCHKLACLSTLATHGAVNGIKSMYLGPWFVLEFAEIRRIVVHSTRLNKTISPHPEGWWHVAVSRSRGERSEAAVPSRRMVETTRQMIRRWATKSRGRTWRARLGSTHNDAMNVPSRKQTMHSPSREQTKVQQQRQMLWVVRRRAPGARSRCPVHFRHRERKRGESETHRHRWATHAHSACCHEPAAAVCSFFHV